MKVSVVIPTYNRPDDLDETLASIEDQTFSPDEVVVVDSSDDKLSRKVVGIHGGQTRYPVRYVRNDGENNLTTSRNIGIERTSGDVLLFLDDDVLLEGEYLLHLADFLQAHPKAKGVQGYQTSGKPETALRTMRRMLAKAFLLSRHERGRCDVLVTGGQTYPIDPAEPLPCQWLSGCNMAYRREVFAHERFDERLKRGSYGEDWDFSYRVWKRWPGSLYLVPQARLVHKGSQASRAPIQHLTKLRVAYSTYLFYKNFDPGPIRRALRAYSRLGELLLYAVEAFQAPSEERTNRFNYLRYWIQGLAQCRRHRDAVAEGRFDFLSEDLSY